MPSNLLQLNILLNGTGTEIPALNTSDNYNVYHIYGTAIAIGNYAIVPTGTLSPGLLYHFKYRGLLDITTNGTTFSLFGTSITAEQLLKDWEADCYYDGTSWEVVLKMDFSEAGIISSSNLGSAITGANISNNSIDACTKLQNLSVCNGKIANDAITTVKILDANVTDAKIADVNGSKITNNTVTNAKLATMANNTVKANISGVTATPSDVSIPTLLNSTAWTTTGNSGLIAGTNFIGTTDATDLVFKANNTEAGRISLSLTNTSFGIGALSSITTGQANVAIGYNSLADLSTISGCTAVGVTALRKTTGQMNTGVGFMAGFENITGQFNTYVGYYATPSAVNTSLNNTIALGYNAEPTVSNQFALPNTVTSFKFRGTSYTLPATDGTANQVLSTNGSGTLSWQDKKDIIIVSVPISFESGEQITASTFDPPTVNHKISKIKGYVSKTLSGTDAGTIEIATNFGTNIISNILIPASTVIDSVISPTISYTSAITGVVEITVNKPTVGGKAMIFIYFEKV